MTAISIYKNIVACI